MNGRPVASTTVRSERHQPQMSAGPPRTRIVIPLRSFSSSKRRLAGVLDDREREILARTMAQLVVDAASGHPVAVACDDDGVAAWAIGAGAEVIRTDGNDLNGSAQMALDDSRARGWDHMVMVHADLPLVTTFDDVLGRDRTALTDDAVLIVPDRRMTGTNLLAVPCRFEFRFAYGPGSFSLHQRAADSVGLGVRIVEDAAFSWDVDEPDDLAIPPGVHLHGGPLADLIDSGLMTVADHAGHDPLHDAIEPIPAERITTYGGNQ